MKVTISIDRSRKESANTRKFESFNDSAERSRIVCKGLLMNKNGILARVTGSRRQSSPRDSVKILIMKQREPSSNILKSMGCPQANKKSMFETITSMRVNVEAASEEVTLRAALHEKRRMKHMTNRVSE